MHSCELEFCRLFVLSSQAAVLVLLLCCVVFVVFLGVCVCLHGCVCVRVFPVVAYWTFPTPVEGQCPLGHGARAFDGLPSVGRGGWEPLAASKGAGTQLFFRRLKRSKDWPKDHAEGGHLRGGRRSSSLRCACCQPLLAGARWRMPAAGVLLGPLPWARAGGAGGLRPPPEYLGEFFSPPRCALVLPMIFVPGGFYLCLPAPFFFATASTSWSNFVHDIRFSLQGPDLLRTCAQDGEGKSVSQPRCKVHHVPSKQSKLRHRFVNNAGNSHGGCRFRPYITLQHDCCLWPTFRKATGFAKPLCGPCASWCRTCTRSIMIGLLARKISCRNMVQPSA